MTAVWFVHTVGQIWQDIFSLFYSKIGEAPFVEHLYSSSDVIFTVKFNGVNIHFIQTQLLSQNFPFVVNMFTELFYSVVWENALWRWKIIYEEITFNNETKVNYIDPYNYEINLSFILKTFIFLNLLFNFSYFFLGNN